MMSPTGVFVDNFLSIDCNTTLFIEAIYNIAIDLS